MSLKLHDYNAMAAYALPSHDRQAYRDEDAWICCPDPKPHLQIEAMYSLTDFTQENGATCIVPCSHR